MVSVFRAAIVETGAGKDNLLISVPEIRHILPQKRAEKPAQAVFWKAAMCSTIFLKLVITS